jgi:hypothetical protein
MAQVVQSDFEAMAPRELNESVGERPWLQCLTIFAGNDVVLVGETHTEG